MSWTYDHWKTTEPEPQPERERCLFWADIYALPRRDVRGGQLYRPDVDKLVEAALRHFAEHLEQQ